MGSAQAGEFSIWRVHKMKVDEMESSRDGEFSRWEFHEIGI